jgi:predicted DNA-binding ribbon-helix-helix protein
VAALVGEIDRSRGETGSPAANLSAAIRLYVLQRLKEQRKAL